MKRFLLVLFCSFSSMLVLAQQGSWDSGQNYTWKYNFGQGENNGDIEFTGSSVFSISTKTVVGFLPQPISGSAKVAVGSTGTATFSLDETDEDGNRGDFLKFQASSTDNIGRVSFYNIEGATALGAVFLTLNFDNNEAVGGNFRLAFGYNDGVASNYLNNTSSVNTGTVGSAIFGAFRWEFTSDPNQIKLEYRVLKTATTAEWKSTTFNFARGTEYAMELYCNNTANGENYTREGDINSYVLPARTYHLWANGERIQISAGSFDFPANELPSGTMINSMMVQGSQSKGIGQEQSTDALVSLTGSGALSYTKYANQGESNNDNVVPDFSNAGYMEGGVSLPNLTVVETISPVPGNNFLNIQSAIDRVQNRLPDANGFRGAILLQAGTYNVDGILRITKSGVVLRGVGQGSNPATNTVVHCTTVASKHIFIRMEGSGSGFGSTSTLRKAITTPYVGSGAISFDVASTSGYSVGDDIGVHRVPNDKWIADLNMAQYGWTKGDYDVVYERKIAAINGNTITLNAPIVDPIQTIYGGGYIFKANITGRISNSGIENMRLTSSYTSDTDENHGWEAIKLVRAENCWVKKVTAQYFGYSCVTLSTQSSYNTIEDCAMLDPKSKTDGGRKYSFNMVTGSFNLFQRLYTRSGRHDFVLGARTAGPNVFLDAYADNPQSDMGPHQRWATGALFDNIRGGLMNVQNRKASGTGHGWTGAQIMFWNCLSTKQVDISSPPGVKNWSIGNISPKHLGNGYQFSPGINVLPRSLYLAQLKDRLGVAAVENITVPAQRAGNIFDALGRWKGEGDLNNQY